MTLKQIFDLRYKCQSCRENGWICGDNPLHIMFKFLQYTEVGKNLNRYIHSSVPKYSNTSVYGWFYDGLEGKNDQKVDYANMRQYYQGITNQLGIDLRTKYDRRQINK